MGAALGPTATSVVVYLVAASSGTLSGFAIFTWGSFHTDVVGLLDLDLRDDGIDAQLSIGSVEHQPYVLVNPILNSVSWSCLRGDVLIEVCLVLAAVSFYFRGGSGAVVDEGETDAMSFMPERVSWPGPHMLKPRDGSFEWLTTTNGREDRLCRCKLAGETLAACRDEGYIYHGSSDESDGRVSLRRVGAMKRGTCIVHAPSVTARPNYGSGCLPRLGSGVLSSMRREPKWFKHEGGKACSVARARALAGHCAALVNAASAYSVGGGFLSGGRHALEESLCVQSTLFCSLSVAAQVKPDGAAPCRYIPEDGVVLSPHVEFFRGGTYDGYSFEANPVEICAIISVALPNCNPEVSDTPVDDFVDRSAYLDALLLRFAALCNAAMTVRARVLVLPDVGCGVYKNDPADVGNAFRSEVCKIFAGAFDEIHLVGSAAFVEAAKPGAAVWCTL